MSSEDSEKQWAREKAMMERIITLDRRADKDGFIATDWFDIEEGSEVIRLFEYEEPTVWDALTRCFQEIRAIFRKRYQ